MKKLADRFIANKTIFLLAVIVCVAFLGYYIGQRETSPGTSSEVEEIERLATPTFQTQLDNQFVFPVEEAQGNQSSFKYLLTEAKKVKLVATRGEPVNANPGEEFLVIGLEIENNNAYPLEVDSQHYFRLVDEAGKSYAPDFYNQAIEIPAASIRRDEIAFIVSAEKREFQLSVGPIDKQDKSTVEIKF